jgi:hypothetical protein
MKREYVYAILAAHWILFASILTILWLEMGTRNLETELEYMKNYNRVITSENLQDIMCNGEPV